MAHGDSEKPNFDDLDFSNLEPIDGDSLADSAADDLADGEGAAEDLMELDFAAVEPLGDEPLTITPLEEPTDAAPAPEAEPTFEPAISFEDLVPEAAPVAEPLASEIPLAFEEAAVEATVEPAAEPVIEPIFEAAPSVEPVAIEPEVAPMMPEPAESSGIDFAFTDLAEEAADAPVAQSDSGLMLDMPAVEDEALEPIAAASSPEVAEEAGLSGLMFGEVDDAQASAEDVPATAEDEMPLEFSDASEQDPAEEMGHELFAEAAEEDAAAQSDVPQFEESQFEEPQFAAAEADASQFETAAADDGAVDFGGFGKTPAFAADDASGITASEQGEEEAALESDEEDEPEEKKQGKFAAFVAGLSESNPYTVLLGIAFGAILLACTLLLAEMWRYEFTISKDKIQQRVLRGPRAAVQYVEPVAGEIRVG